MDIVVFMLIGLVAGWLAGVLVKGSSYGVVGDLVVGVLGALIGGSLFQRLGISAGGGLLGAIIVATVGAVILLVILRLINQSRMGSVRLSGDGDRGLLVKHPSPFDKQADDDDAILDAVIVGGGIGGIVMLAEGVAQGTTKILLLERSGEIGGIWARLPAWQTIQNHPLDFCLQGFTPRKRVWHAGDVLHFLADYVRVQRLEPFIRLRRDLRGCVWLDEAHCWSLVVAAGPGAPATIRCRRLILCTGRHAEPIVPPIDTDKSVPIVHSSAWQRPAEAAGKRVVVIGGGASALDLCALVLAAQEDDGGRGRLHWVLRKAKFFSGTGVWRLWPVTVLQLALGTTASTFLLNAFLDAHARTVFWWHGRSAWLPVERLDLRDTQYIPGRRGLLEHAGRIDRHPGAEVETVRFGRVTLTDGTRLDDIDLILLGTGYAPPAPIDGVGDLGELALKTFATGQHRGRLFLVGERLLDTTGAAPIAYHAFSRVFWTLLRDEAALEEVICSAGKSGQPEPNLNHLDLFNRIAALGSHFHARRGPLGRLFPWATWRGKMLWTTLVEGLWYRTTVLFADRLLGHGLSLDEPATRSIAVTNEPRGRD